MSFLLSKSLKFPVKHEEILKQYNSFPRLSRVDHEEFSDARVRKVHLELTLGLVLSFSDIVLCTLLYLIELGAVPMGRFRVIDYNITEYTNNRMDLILQRVFIY